MKPKLIELTERQERLLSGPPETAGMKSGHVVLAVGEESGRHSTGEREEMIIVRSGAGVVEIDGQKPLAVSRQIICYIPPGTWHNVKNNGRERLDYVYVVTPAGKAS
ncbi:MAG: cupin domain-containing protein [Elusimicrobia bacterium]|nr:cupin domain-containing protein [Elusimicrobiota bacterium]